MEYNYYTAVKDDIIDYIESEAKYSKMDVLTYLEENKTNLYDDLFISDNVTGNASGSYTFSTWQAAEYLTHNWFLLDEAINEFECTNINVIEKGEEWADVTIRCYLLNECLSEAIEKLKESRGQ